MTSPRVYPGEYCMCHLEDHVFCVVGAVLCVAGRPMGLFFKNYLSLFIYLAVAKYLLLSCSKWDLQSSLWHVGSFVWVSKLLVVARGI